MNIQDAVESAIKSGTETWELLAVCADWVEEQGAPQPLVQAYRWAVKHEMHPAFCTDDHWAPRHWSWSVSDKNNNHVYKHFRPALLPREVFDRMDNDPKDKNSTRHDSFADAMAALAEALEKAT